MKYVKCIYNHNDLSDITINKIYKVEEKHISSDIITINGLQIFPGIPYKSYYIIDDKKEYCWYSEELFIDATREMKLKKILNEIC